MIQKILEYFDCKQIRYRNMREVLSDSACIRRKKYVFAHIREVLEKHLLNQYASRLPVSDIS